MNLRCKWLRRKQSPKGFRPRWRGFCKRGHPKRVFEPSSGQLEFARRLMGSCEANVILRGAVGSGKTTAALFTADLLCRTYPHYSILVWTRSKEHTLDVLQQLGAPGHVVEWHSILPRRCCVRYPNGSRMELEVAYAPGPEWMRASEFDCLIADRNVLVDEGAWFWDRVRSTRCPKRVVTLDDHWEVVDLGNPHMGRGS